MFLAQRKIVACVRKASYGKTELNRNEEHIHSTCPDDVYRMKRLEWCMAYTASVPVDETHRQTHTPGGDGQAADRRLAKQWWRTISEEELGIMKRCMSMLRCVTIRRSLVTATHVPKIRVNTRFLDELGKDKVHQRGGKISKDIPQIFGSRTDAAVVGTYIDKNLSRMNTPSVVALLTVASKNNFLLSDTHIEAIAKVLREHHPPLVPKQVSNVIYSLNHMKGPSSAVRELLKVAVDGIEKTSNPLVPLGPRNICHTLFGLRGMDCTTPEVKQLLTALEREISSASSLFVESDVTFAMQGLQNMSTDVPEVRAILRSLVVKMHDTDEQYSARGISVCLYALRNLLSEVDEVRMCLRGLLHHWHDNDAISMGEGEIALSLTGLRNADGQPREEREILDRLAEQVEKLDDIFDLISLVSVLNGLKSKDELLPVTRRLLQALPSKIYAPNMKSQRRFAHKGRLCKDDSVLNKLFRGMQNFTTSESSATRPLVGALAQRMHFEMSGPGGEVQQLKMSSATLQRIMAWMLNIKNTYYVWDPVNEFANPCVKEAELQILLISRMVRAVPTKAFISPTHMISIANNLKNLQLPPGNPSSPADEHAEVRHLLTSLADAFEATVSAHAGKEVWSCGDVALAMQGLRGCSGSHSEARRLIRIYLDLLRDCAARSSGKPVLTPRALTGILAGLAEKGLQHVEVSGIVDFIVQQLHNMEVSGELDRFHLSVDRYAIALSGLSGLHSDDIRVRTLIARLCDMVVKEDGSLRWTEHRSALPLPSMMRSLRCMKNECTEVRQLLKIIARVIREESQQGGYHTLSQRGQFMTFYYLRDMDAATCTEMEDVIEALTKVLQERFWNVRGSKKALTVSASNICHVLSGMRSTDMDKSGAALDLVQELTRIVRCQETPMPIGTVCAIVNGFQSTSCVDGNPLIGSFLSALVEPYPSVVEEIRLSDILKFVTGLRRVGDDGERLWELFMNSVVAATIIEDDKSALQLIVDILRSNDYAARDTGKLMEALIHE